MPRAQQSREGQIVGYFATAPLEIAVVVMRLSADALRARQARSTEAKKRASQGKQAQPSGGGNGTERVAAPPMAGLAVPRPQPAPATAAPKPVRRRKRRTRAQMQAATDAKRHQQGDVHERVARVESVGAPEVGE